MFIKITELQRKISQTINKLYSTKSYYRKGTVTNGNKHALRTLITNRGYNALPQFSQSWGKFDCDSVAAAARFAKFSLHPPTAVERKTWCLASHCSQLWSIYLSFRNSLLSDNATMITKIMKLYTMWLLAFYVLVFLTRNIEIIWLLH